MSAERYLIGDVTLDLSQGCLRRNGADVALRPKSFALLHYLVIHAGRLVSKDELLSKIWPDVFVTEDFADPLHQRSPGGARRHQPDDGQDGVEARLHLRRTGLAIGRGSGRADANSPGAISNAWAGCCRCSGWPSCSCLPA